MSFYDFHQTLEDPRKKRFVAVRMELALFHSLSEEAQRRGTDLSETIRQLCNAGLNGDRYEIF